MNSPGEISANEPSPIEVPQSWSKCVITGCDKVVARANVMNFLKAGTGCKLINGVLTLSPISGRVLPLNLQEVLANLKRQSPDAQIIFS